MSIKWSVYVDWNGNGSFADANEDITTYVEAWNSRVGSNDPKQRVASAGKASLTLKNADRRFSPENTGGPLYGNLKPMRAVKITATDGTTTWTIFYGYITRIVPASGRYGINQYKCQIECTDLLGLLMAYELDDIPPQTNQYASTLVQMIINSALGAPSATNSATCTANPALNETITINGTAYRFVNALSQANDVLIGTYRENTAQNLINCINGAAGAGSTYHASSTRPSGVYGRWDGDSVAINSPATNAYAIGAVGGTPQWLAQSFAMTKNTGVVQQLQVVLGATTGAPTGTMTWELRSDSAGAPGTVLQSGTFTPTASATNTITVAGGITLTKNTTYWLTLRPTSAQTGSNYWTWSNGASAYPAGVFDYSNNSGSSWTTFTGLAGSCRIALVTTATFIASLRGAAGNAYTLAQSAATWTLGGATFSGGADYPTSPAPVMDTGSVIDYAGDTWRGGQGKNALSAIDEVVASKYGRFFQQRDGTLTYRDYQWDAEKITTVASLTITDQVRSLEGAVDAASIFNRVTVTVHPRTVGGSTVVVASSPSTLTVPPNATGERYSPSQGIAAGTFKLQYRDAATGRFIGAASLAPLTANTDYTVWTDATAGSDYTNSGLYSMSVAQSGGQVEVSCNNRSGQSLYIRNLQVRGNTVTAYDPIMQVAEDTTSQGAPPGGYYRRTLALDLPLANDANFALSLAQYLLAKYKDSTFRLATINFGTLQKIGAVNLFSLAIGDIITLTEYQLGISTARYMIIGITYSSGPGDGTIAPAKIPLAPKTGVSFDVVRLDDYTYWILGDATYGLLGSTTRLYV